MVDYSKLEMDQPITVKSQNVLGFFYLKMDQLQNLCKYIISA